MDMQKEVEAVRKKIAMLDEQLPEGYTPDIGSRWELVELAIEQRDRKSWSVWVRSCAAILLLGCLSYLFLKPEAELPVRANDLVAVENVLPEKRASHQENIAHEKSGIKVKAVKPIVQPVVLRKMVREEVASPDSQIQVIACEIAETPVADQQVALVTPSKPQRRMFKKLDFGQSQQPEKHVVAASENEKLQFSLLLLLREQSQPTGERPPSFSIHKTF